MKKLLLLSIIIICYSLPSQASHTLGGEIGWKCLSTGKYQFYMTFYRDCSGIPWPYNNENLVIEGSPLPKDANGMPFSTIVLKPDSTRWRNERFGDTAPNCSSEYGNAWSCENGDNGIVQQFFYLSDPVTMKGVPPRNGWKFFLLNPICCRPSDIENVDTTPLGDMLLRAAMYSTKNRDDADPCVDSSPKFIDAPITVFCRGSKLTYTYNAVDTDLDSLVYSWDRPYDGPTSAPVSLPYETGFSSNNPTPDSSFDPRNIAATINPENGLVKMAVYSGSNVKKYITIGKVASYRDGTLISEVFREVPISFFDCPGLPNGKANNPPKTVFNGDTTQEYTIEVIAGQAINVPIEVIDNDYWDSLNTKQQVLSLQPEGSLFSRNRQTATPCQITQGRGGNISIEPCAYLENLAPFLDTSSDPPQYHIQDTASMQTNFVWQTSCSHVQTLTGTPGKNVGVYDFIFKVQDDACPIPAITYPTLTVKVKDPIPLTEPIMKGVSVDLEGKVTYQWVPPIDSAFSFGNYIVQATAPQNGNMPTWLPGALNPNLKTYRSKKKNIFYPIYVPQANILQKIPNRDWYFRMTTLSGCSGNEESSPSEPVRIIEPEITPSGVFPEDLRSKLTITWNSPKPVTAESYNYFEYESKTHYYIWQNDSVSNGGVADSSNWYLRDSTLANEITLASNTCLDYAAFRIEARDTVITWKQGSGLGNSLDSTEVLSFRTFSVIDTAFLKYSEPSVQRIGVETINADYPAEFYQWIDCNADTLIANATQRELLLSDTGSYAVITQSGQCMDTSACFKVKVDINNSIEKRGRDTLVSLESLANYQWMNVNSGTQIQGATSQRYIATDTGRYAAILSVFNTSDTSEVVKVALSLNDSIVLLGKDTLKSLDDDADYQWYNCGLNAIIPGATEQTYVMRDTGNFAVIVSEFGYSDTSSCYPYFPIGLAEPSFKEGIVVYPNPTNGALTIRLNNNYKKVNLRVLTIHGQLVQKQQLSQQKLIELSLTGDSGIYFIQLVNEKGEQANFKVVKQ